MPPAAPAPVAAPAAPPSTPKAGTPAGQVAPASPAPPAQPPSPDKPPQTPLNDAFAEIDKIIADSQQKRPDRTPAKAPEKPAEKPAGSDKGEPEKPAAPAQDESQTLKAPELRAAYSAKKKELGETREKLTAAEARLKELEAQLGDGSQLTKLQEQLTQRESRLKELEEAVKFADYEKSPEYKEKFYKPFVDAYANGQNKVASLRVLERKNDVDEVIQAGRKATADDFDAIMRISDDGQAAELADRLFGPMANLVIYHREKVMDLNTARVNAIDEFRKVGGEREQQTAAAMQQLQERTRGIYKQAVDSGLAKYPQWFKADDGDDQGKAMLEKGMVNADMIFSDAKQPPERMAQLHAAFRNMAGAFPFVALKLHRAEARIKELEGELDAFKKSEPAEPSRERGEKPAVESVDDEIDRLAGARR